MNGSHYANEEWKTTINVADHKMFDCTDDANATSTIIARDGSVFDITMSCCTCTSESTRHIMISTAQIRFTVGLHQLLQCTYDCVESLINSVCKTVSALGSNFGTCSYPMPVIDNFSTYKYEAHHAILSWWCKACLSLDCIKQSSAFCSQDHYRLYQKLTFYNSAIGKGWHIQAFMHIGYTF